MKGNNRYNRIFISLCKSCCLGICILTAVLNKAAAQLPQCDRIYFDESAGNNLYSYDPRQPVSATNPLLNSIQMPPGHGGLAISEVLGSGNTALTYYTVVNREYRYYDAGTASWVATGHYATDSIALNIGAGGGYLYNLNGLEGKIYRYDGTGNDTLIVTDNEFNGGSAFLIYDRPFDLIADCEGNFFLFNSTGLHHTPFLKKYNPEGSLLQQWTVVNPITQGMGTGFAILEDTLYVGSYNTGNEIRWATLDNAQVTINTAPTLINGIFPGDMATCGDAIKLNPEVTVTAGQDSLCGPAPVTFHAGVTNGGSNPVYLWLVNGQVAGSNDSVYQYTPADGDEIVCVYTAQGMCSALGRDTSNIVRMVVSLPVDAGFSYERPECDKLDYVFSATPANAAYGYNWTFGDGITGSGSIAQHTYAGAGTPVVQLVVTNGACRDTVVKTLDVQAASTFELSDILPVNDTVIRYGDAVQLNASGGISYLWTPAGRVSKADTPSPMAYPVESTVFTVVSIDSMGCIDSASRRIDIIYPPIPPIPNAFSPNGDGLNDFFRIPFAKYFKVITFRVFNRWGELVYTTMDPESGWDGTYKGMPAETGVYFYQIRLESPDKKRIDFKGDVTLIR